ncbi:MAG TPA: hypothetical protein VME70_03950 [Mycobacteriales bacterium]|nr:hypothetical protein [Mycobacteriales bacterium]
MSQSARRRRPLLAAVLTLGVIGGLVSAPAIASAARIAPQRMHAVMTSPTTAAKAPAKSSGGWKWSPEFNLGRVTGLKKHLQYETTGVACPDTHLCVIPMFHNGGTYTFSPAGDFYATDPAKGEKGWKFSKWNEDYEPSDSGSLDNIACEPAGKATDCIIAGQEPVIGSYDESYGGTIFQTGTPTSANWGADNFNGYAAFGSVSCWVNVQCVEINDNGIVFSTAGANVRATATVFKDDTGFAGIWSISCAQWSKSQPNPFCALVDGNSKGSVAWTTNPDDPGMTWHRTNLGHKYNLMNIACFGPGACLIDNDGTLLRTHGKTVKAWPKGFKTVTLPKVGKHADVGAIKCTGDVCAVGGVTAKGEQFISVSGDPAKGHWDTTFLSKSHKIKNGIDYLACASTKLCVVGDSYGDTAVGRR